MNAGRAGKIHSVAILGGGPVACTLAILLTRAGRRVAMLHRPRTAPLLVGESLVPAIVLMLRKLGLEAEVAAYSQVKPGACCDFGADVVFPVPY